MSYSAQGKGFFGVVTGSTSWNDNILNYDKYLETSGDTIQLKTGYSFNMNAETHLSMQQVGLSGRIFMYRLSTTTDRDYMGQYGGYTGSAAVYSDDRAIETSNSSFTFSKYTESGSGSVSYIPESCCTIIFFYAN